MLGKGVDVWRPEDCDLSGKDPESAAENRGDQTGADGAATKHDAESRKDQLEQLYAELEYLRSREGFNSCYRSLREMLAAVIRTLRPQEQLPQDRVETPGVICTFQAPPGSGKSFTTQIVCRILELEGVSYELIHWDRVEEQLREEGLITTPSGMPYTDKELKLVYDRVLMLMREKVAPGIALILDLPSETSLAVPVRNNDLDEADEETQVVFVNARHYATGIIRGFMESLQIYPLNRPAHTNSNRHKPDALTIMIFVNHLIPGPCTDLLRYLRAALMLLKKLERPNDIRALFGLKALSEAELEALQQQLGGSLAQLEAADMAWRQILNVLASVGARGFTVPMLEQLAELGFNFQLPRSSEISSTTANPDLEDLQPQVAVVARILNRKVAEYAADIRERLKLSAVIRRNTELSPTPDSVSRRVSLFFSNPEHLFAELFANEEMILRLQSFINHLENYENFLHKNNKTATDRLLNEISALLDSGVLTKTELHQRSLFAA
jgi:hypothetical protein